MNRCRRNEIAKSNEQTSTATLHYAPICSGALFGPYPFHERHLLIKLTSTATEMILRDPASQTAPFRRDSLCAGS